MIKKFFAPDGAPIVGTLQTVEAIAMIEGLESSAVDPIYTGDSKILWETMEPKLKGLSSIFVDDQGRRWSLGQLRSEDDPEGGIAIQRRGTSRARRPADADPARTEVSVSEA